MRIREEWYTTCGTILCDADRDESRVERLASSAELGVGLEVYVSRHGFRFDDECLLTVASV